MDSLTAPLFALLAEKEKALATAQAAAKELKEQVDSLKSTIQTLKPTRFEQFLKGEAPAKTPHQEADALTLPSGEIVQIDAQPIPEVQQEQDQSGKKPKGVVSQTLVEVMSDSVVRTIDQALAEANKRLPTPTTHGSVRSTLGILKNQGRVVSVGYGKYQIAPQEGGSTSTEAFSQDDLIDPLG